MKQHSNVPFIGLGQKLKKVREVRRETLAEVSGAVEIDIQTLQEIESGKVRPEEDTMLLLITHFALKDDEADSLWMLGGYSELYPIDVNSEDINEFRPSAAVMPSDIRIVYTDTVHVVVNNFGVVMNFMQMSGPNAQPLMISRVGMSKEHAYSVLEVLRKTLEHADTNANKNFLPPKTEDNTKK
jgi:DNA-binding XRE family transcriptional regulator